MKKDELFKTLPQTIDKNSKILLLTHTDADGAGATVIVKSIFTDVKVEHCSNAVMSASITNAIITPEIADAYDYIIACDISCTETDASMININKNRDKLIIIDHHITAAHLNNYKFAAVSHEILSDSYRNTYYDMIDYDGQRLSSGTSLLYDYMEYIGLTKEIENDTLLREMVHLIASYDTWDWYNVFNKKSIYNEFQSLCDLYGIELFEESLLKKLKSNRLFDETDKLLIKIESEKIRAYIERTEKCYCNGTLELKIKGETKYYDTVYSYSSDYMSETYEHMKELYPDADLYLINYGTGISLRAIKDTINVAEIAKQYGGGGHPGAGGFKIPFDLQRNYIEQAFSGKLYRQ